MVRQWLVCLVTIGFSVLATADVVRLYPYPSDYIGDPAEGAMRWYLAECDYGYALTYIGRCHWIDHPYTNESGEVSHRWTCGYETPTGHYTVPNTVSGYVGTNYYTLAVKGLGAGAAVFTNLYSVTISEGIEEICGAFYDVTNLTHVGFPTTLRRIRTGNYCSFGNCRSLQSITLPTNLEVLGAGSFSASGLTSVELPEGVIVARLVRLMILMILVPLWNAGNCCPSHCQTGPFTWAQIRSRIVRGCGRYGMVVVWICRTGVFLIVHRLLRFEEALQSSASVILLLAVARHCRNSPMRRVWLKLAVMPLTAVRRSRQ